MSNHKILVVEDEFKLLEVIRDYLIKENYEVTIASNGVDALRSIEESLPDLLITDLMLPDISGEEIVSIIRKTSSIPIIMLTAKTMTEDRINGLTIGADDYITKPFSLRELMLRVNNLIGRVYGNQKTLKITFELYKLVIDIDAHTVHINHQEVIVTKFEFDILVVLAQNPNRTFSREQLIELTAGYDYFGFDRTIDTHIKNLRKKIEPDDKKPTIIKTVYGVGYKFYYPERG